VRQALYAPDLQEKELDLLQNYEKELQEEDNSWSRAFADDLKQFHVFTHSSTDFFLQEINDQKESSPPASEFTKQLQGRRNPATCVLKEFADAMGRRKRKRETYP
jgi:hypothetical protein